MLPSYQAAPILAACGLPSRRTVPRKEAASASAPASRRSRARFHGSGSVADVLSRLVVAVGSRLVMSLRPHRDRELIAGRRFHSRRASTSNPLRAPASDVQLGSERVRKRWATTTPLPRTGVFTLRSWSSSAASAWSAFAATTAYPVQGERLAGGGGRSPTCRVRGSLRGHLPCPSSSAQVDNRVFVGDEHLARECLSGRRPRALAVLARPEVREHEPVGAGCGGGLASLAGGEIHRGLEHVRQVAGLLVAVSG